MRWNSPAVRTLIQLGLKEDAARQDITTRTLIPANLKIEAQIRSKQAGVICGLPMAAVYFKQLDRRILFKAKVREGQFVKPGALLAVIRGKARAILSAERPALNALQHLSGVATTTRNQVNRLNSRHTSIYDTRKTLPGWRELQKYAVRCGGGKNHRMTLASSMLIKDNHLQLCRLVKKDWLSAVKRLQRARPALDIELEIQTAQDIKDALTLKPRRVLLDNMSPKRLRALTRTLRAKIPGVEIEVSGGIRTAQLTDLRRLGIERISMGRLTHSAPALDCALDITHVFHPR